MSKPLALVYYTNLLPGSHLTVLLQDLGYRVQPVNAAALLPDACEKDMPLVIVAELMPAISVCTAIAQIKSNPATKHIPVLAYSRMHDVTVQSQAREAGVNLLAAEGGIAEQLPQLLEQILQVE